MTIRKHIAGIVLGAALLAPSAVAAPDAGYGLPRAMPSDYAAVQGALPRAMPADYGRAGVTLTRLAGMPRAMPADYGRYLASTQIEPRAGFDWIAAAIGAATMLGALLLGALAARRVRRNARKAVLLGSAVLAAVAIGVPIAVAAATELRNTTDVRLRVVTGEFADGFDSGWHTHPGPVIVQVEEGAFKMYQNGCEPTVVQKGETFVEIPFVPIRAVAKGYIKWTTSQVLPAADAPQTNLAESLCD